MSAFDLDQEGWAQRVGDAQVLATQPQEEEKPGLFAGTFSAIGKGLGRGLVKLEDLLSMGLPASTGEPDLYTLEGVDQAQAAQQVEDPDAKRAAREDTRRRALDQLTPDVHSTGAAARVLGGFSEIVPALVAGGGTPSLLVGQETLASGKELVDQGVDSTTAGAAAAVQGAATYAGFKIPILGKTATGRIATGVGGNVTFGALTREAQQQLLSQRGYEELASNYSPLDGEAVLVDALTGAVFGGLHHIAAPSERAATAAVNNAKHFQVDTAPGGIADVRSSTSHQAALETALDQAVHGEPVSVPGEVLDANFTKRPPREVPIPDYLKEIDANRATVAQRDANLDLLVRRARDAELDAQLTVEEPGEHNDNQLIVRSPQGFTKARIVGGEYLQVTLTETMEKGRGTGEGTARMRRLMAIAEERGLTLTSDTLVSADAQRFYEKLSKKEGFDVIRNDAHRFSDGTLGSDDSRPVFEVHPQALEEYDATHEEASQFQGLRSDVPADQNVGRGGEGIPAEQGGAGNGGARGEPLKVYRGGVAALSKKDFSRGKLAGATTRPILGLGAHFSNNPTRAAHFGTVTEHHLDIRNPAHLSFEDLPYFRTPAEYRKFAADLKKQGYDGVIVDASHVGGPVDFFAFDMKQVKEAPKSPASVDPRLADPAVRADLENLRSHIGLNERGGRMIRKSEDPNSPDYRTVTGRTQHVGSPLWMQRPGSSEGKAITAENALKALDNVRDGKPLGAAQARFVKYMLDELDDVTKEWQDYINQEADAAREVDPDVEAVRNMLAESDIQIPTGELDAEGNMVTRSAREIMAQAEADIAQAENDSKGFEAAVSCFLMRGPDAS